MKNKPIRLSADERRLVRLYRCADDLMKNETLTNLESSLWEKHLGEKSVYSFMPHGGVDPVAEEIDNPNSVAYVISQGMNEIGEESLFAPCDDDEDELAKSFANSANEAAMNQGSFFNYDKQFALEYLRTWREQLVEVIEHLSLKGPKGA